MTAVELLKPDSELPPSGTFGPVHFTADQLDALREIVNVAMGRAGEALSQLVDRFIELPVPDVRLVGAGEIVSVIREWVPEQHTLTVIRQAFRCIAPGECFVLFGDKSGSVLGQLTHPTDSSTATSEEMLLDVGNLLAGACVGGIAEQLNRDTTYSPPSILCVDKLPTDILDPSTLPWVHALVLRVNFRIEGESFLAHVLLFWPEKAIYVIGQHLTAFLDGL